MRFVAMVGYARDGIGEAEDGRGKSEMSLRAVPSVYMTMILGVAPTQNIIRGQ